MENPEEILQCLEEFSKIKPRDIPRELEEYLCFVAKTGNPVYQWPVIKCLFRQKLINVINEFSETCPVGEIQPCLNVDLFSYNTMKTFILEKLDTFVAAPFTVQRICELLTTPRKQYNRIDKYMRALEKNILVVSTTEPVYRSTENGENNNQAIVNGLESDHMSSASSDDTPNINIEEMDDTPPHHTWSAATTTTRTNAITTTNVSVLLSTPSSNNNNSLASPPTPITSTAAESDLDEESSTEGNNSESVVETTDTSDLVVEGVPPGAFAGDDGGSSEEDEEEDRLLLAASAKEEEPLPKNEPESAQLSSPKRNSATLATNATSTSLKESEDDLETTESQSETSIITPSASSEITEDQQQESSLEASPTEIDLDGACIADNLVVQGMLVVEEVGVAKLDEIGDCGEELKEVDKENDDHEKAEITHARREENDEDSDIMSDKIETPVNNKKLPNDENIAETCAKDQEAIISAEEAEQATNLEIINDFDSNLQQDESLKKTENNEDCDIVKEAEKLEKEVTEMENIPEVEKIEAEKLNEHAEEAENNVIIQQDERMEVDEDPLPDILEATSASL